jgi:hypothetical protein
MPTVKLDSKSMDVLYEIFRKKMHDIYVNNYSPDPFSDAMTKEFNAWQKYLRESLALEVIDAEPGERTGFVWDKDRNCKVKIMNPSNGASFSKEYILVPSDLAEKTLVLGSLPETL